jgi:secreted Zn-dependent insulinase-like peptidase
MSKVMSHPLPRQLLLCAPYVSTEWLPSKVGELLELMTPENGRIFLSAQEEIGGRTYRATEHWYGTEYCIEPMSDEITFVSLLRHLVFSFSTLTFYLPPSSSCSTPCTAP